MIKEQKLWLCGMFRGDREILENTIAPILKYFDGLIAVIDARCKQEDIDWLNSIKGEGEIIVRKWVNDHAWTMNHFLLSGKMKFPDYFVIVDETDKLNEFFVQDLRESIKYWNQNNIGMIYLDHPFVIRYHDGARIVNNPHWGQAFILGNTINLQSISGHNKENYLSNTRDVFKSAILSPAKYYICYPNYSNQTELIYRQFGDDIWKQHENVRINFRLFCQLELGLDLFTLDPFIDYLKNNVGKYPEFLEKIIELEVNVKDVFRVYVLNQTLADLCNNRHNWSYFTWKEKGIIDQKINDGFVGIFNKYLRDKGEPTQ